MKPELSVKKKVLALERRKQQLDSLIAFIKSHPHATNGTRLIPLWHRTGLLFDDYALIRPMYVGDKVMLRLERYTEDWPSLHPDSGYPFDFDERTLCKDVSKMGEKKLAKMLEKIHREIHPEDFDDEE